MDLKVPIRELGLTFKLQARKLEKLGITTLENLLMHAPARYENYNLISPINLLQQGEIATIVGKVEETQNIYTKFRKKIQKIKVTNTTGSIECIWFNQQYVLKTIKENDLVSIAGKVSLFNRKLCILVNDYEVLENEKSKAIHTQGFVPVYPETRGLTSKWLRNRIKEIIKKLENENLEYLPESIRQKHNLFEFKQALKQIHFPVSLEQANEARKRLAFDELFLTQLNSAIKRQEWKKKKTAHVLKVSAFEKEINAVIKSLPFELTNSQQKAIKEIFKDFESSEPMNRLLEGDVGSGKTIVAAISMYAAYLNGYQSVIMAPTEILANQHYNTISNILSKFDVKVGLITSSKKELGIRNKELSNDQNSSFIIHNSKFAFDILVGTHALINQKVKFEKLALVIIDEQQRFGVEQRSILREKGLNPHFLTMTATPIPRTIFLTLYGDLELSYLSEMPKGRKKVKTWLVPKFKRDAAYEWIKSQLSTFNSQLFIVCPFIEESESAVTIKAATKEYEYLKDNVFKNFNVGLLHGKMKGKDKDTILKNFKDQKLDILVATPVVEVGIDIPNATIMLIEGAERFGLAQLHQLRGRVGRGSKESYCLLFTESDNPKTIQRLKFLETAHLGAELAELDLKLRGPGELYGTLQHGNNTLKIASFSDFELIEKTKKEAERILPEISKHEKLLEKIKTLETKSISPD